MELSWFYIAVVLAISDKIHIILMWNIFTDFYIVLGDMIKRNVVSNIMPRSFMKL